MNLNSPFRQNVIQIRSSNKSSTRKRNLLLKVLIPKAEAASNRSTLSSELGTPKSSQLPVNLQNSSFLATEKERIPDPFTSSSVFSKLYSTYYKSPNQSCQFTPVNVATEQGTQDLKRVRYSKRSDVIIDKAKSLTDPDISLMRAAPLKPDSIFKNYLQHLTKYEQVEILDYSEIYFIGMNCLKAKLEAHSENPSFDDEKKHYKVIIGDHIAYRYEVQQKIGQGSFGVVCKCYDHKEKKYIALKIIRNDPSFSDQARVELEILEYISKNDLEDKSQCIHIKEHFLFRDHLCYSFELLSVNLYQMITSNNRQGFSLSLVRRFVAQIISALIYLNQHKIIHCDLKPENISLKEFNKSGVKIIDFGSACFEGQKIYTYIQSRFYRAPEIMLGAEYTSAIDMWSLGCIAAELFTGVPLFAGESDTEQLHCIIEVKGLPPKDLLEKSTRKKVFFDGDSLKFFENSKGKQRIPSSQTLMEKIRSNDRNFLEFLNDCLEWSPSKRLTPEQAFYHEFIQEGLRDFHRNSLRLRSSST